MLASRRREIVLNDILPALEKNPFINDEFVDLSCSDTIPVVDPATELAACEVLAGKSQHIAAAVSAARLAFDQGPWPRMSYNERIKYLLRLADLIDRDRERLALLESFDSGRPYTGVRAWDIPHASELLRYYSSASSNHLTNSNRTPRRSENYVVKEPVGVCAQILPWNFPFPSAFWKLAPALAVGCTCILKPSEKTPLSAQYLASLIQEAEFPPGVINIVCGFGETAGAALVNDPRVDKICFTGAIATAQTIMSSTAHNLPRFTFELGGKNANIICSDADLDDAVEGTYGAMFSCQGQNCCAASRTYVHSSIFEEFAEKLTARTKLRRIGDPLEDGIEQGPQIDAQHLKRIQGYVERAMKTGVHIHCGGNRLPQTGYFFAPTIFSEVDHQSEIAKEEVFGPVGCLFTFSELDEVINYANDSSYGLAAGIWTKNMSTAQQFVQRVRVGTCWVNCFDRVEVDLPFGGYKMSGQGRELGLEALNAYTECKTVMVV